MDYSAQRDNEWLAVRSVFLCRVLLGAAREPCVCLLPGDCRFVSATFRLFKLPKTEPAGRCQVVYNGGIMGHEKELIFDANFTFKVKKKKICPLGWQYGPVVEHLPVCARPPVPSSALELSRARIQDSAAFLLLLLLCPPSAPVPSLDLEFDLDLVLLF